MVSLYCISNEIGRSLWLGEASITSIRSFQGPCHLPFLQGVAGGVAISTVHWWTLGLREIKVTWPRLPKECSQDCFLSSPCCWLRGLTPEALILLTSPFYSERKARKRNGKGGGEEGRKEKERKKKKKGERWGGEWGREGRRGGKNNPPKAELVSPVGHKYFWYLFISLALPSPVPALSQPGWREWLSCFSLFSLPDFWPIGVTYKGNLSLYKRELEGLCSVHAQKSIQDFARDRVLWKLLLSNIPAWLREEHGGSDRLSECLNEGSPAPFSCWEKEAGMGVLPITPHLPKALGHRCGVEVNFSAMFVTVSGKAGSHSFLSTAELAQAFQPFSGHTAYTEQTGQDLRGLWAFDDLFIVYLFTLCN